MPESQRRTKRSTPAAAHASVALRYAPRWLPFELGRGLLIASMVVLGTVSIASIVSISIDSVPDADRWFLTACVSSGLGVVLWLSRVLPHRPGHEPGRTEVWALPFVGVVLAVMLSAPFLVGHRIDARVRTVSLDIDEQLRRQTLERLGEIPPDPVTAIVQLPGSQVVAAGGSDGVLLVSDAEGKGPIEVGRHEGWIHALAVVGRTHVLSGGTGGVIRRWRADFVAPPETIGHHGDLVLALCSLHDGRFISVARDGSLRRWDTTSAPRWEALGQSREPLAAATCAPGGQVVTASRLGRLLRWDGGTGSPPVEFGTHRTEILEIVALDARNIVTLDEDGSILSWDTGGELSVRRLGISHDDEAHVRTIAAMADGRVVGAGVDAHGGFARIYQRDDYLEGRELGRHGAAITAVTELRDGRIIAAATRMRAVDVGPFDAMRMWDPRILESEDLGRPPGRTIYAATILPGGGAVTVGAREGVVQAWADGGAKGRELGRTEQRLMSLVAIDHERFLSIDKEGDARLWSTRDGESEPLAELGKLWHAGALQDGRLLLAGRDGQLRAWDILHEQMTDIGTTDGQVVGFASVDPHHFVMWGLATVELWRLEGSLGSRVDHREMAIARLALLRPGRFVSADRKGTLRAWGFDGSEAVELGTHVGHWIASLAVLEDGRVVSAESRHGTIRLWDMDGTSWALGHQGGGLMAVGVQADGRVLGIGRDQSLRLWDPDDATILPPGDAYEDPRSIADRYSSDYSPTKSDIEAAERVLPELLRLADPATTERWWEDLRARQATLEAGHPERFVTEVDELNARLYPEVRPPPAAQALRCAHGLVNCGIPLADFGSWRHSSPEDPISQERAKKLEIWSWQRDAAVANVARLGAVNCSTAAMNRTPYQRDARRRGSDEEERDLAQIPACNLGRLPYLHWTPIASTLWGLLVSIGATLVVLARSRGLDPRALGALTSLALLVAVTATKWPSIGRIVVLAILLGSAIGILRRRGRRRMLTRAEGALVVWSLLTAVGLSFVAILEFLGRSGGEHTALVVMSTSLSLLAASIMLRVLESSLARFFSRPLRVGALSRHPHPPPPAGE